MRTHALLLLWLGWLLLLAGCTPEPAPLPELITLPAPQPSAVPVLTATGLPLEAQPLETSTPSGPTPTPLPGWCSQAPAPLGTPAGQLRIAFVKDKDVWIWQEGRAARRLTSQGDVEQVFLSDDGQMLAYLRTAEARTQSLWRVDAQGGQAEQVLSAADFNRMRSEPNQVGVTPFNLSWIPGTHRLVFNTYPVLPGEGIWVYVPDDLWVVDLERSSRANLLPKGQGGHFSFSPDGQLAAVFTPSALMLMYADGKVIQRDVLEGFQAVGLGEYYSYPTLQWALDSRTLLVAIPVWDEPGQAHAGAVIWKVPADGSQPSLVRSIPSSLSLAAFSPDLAYLAYFFQPDQRSSGRELRLSDLDGKEEFLFLRGEVMERFQWLPDGRHFLYWMVDAWLPRLGHICQDTPPFPDFPVRSDIHWVDASRFLFLSGGNGNWELNLGYVSGELITIAELGGSSFFAFRIVGGD